MPFLRSDYTVRTRQATHRRIQNLDHLVRTEGEGRILDIELERTTDPERSSSLARRLFTLPSEERRGLLRCWWALLGADLGLRFSPRRSLARALAAGDELGLPTSLDEATALARQVARVAAHHLWPMHCLPRALALTRLLRAQGHAARMRIGVRRAGTRLEAHAWVELAGTPIGEPEAIADRFLPFAPPELPPPAS